jgi:hypothetical protein
MSDPRTILEAIALQKCLVVTYNRVTMKLAPHILYTRDDALHIDAVALEREGQPPKEKKLGVFRLSGLNDLALTEEKFAVEPLFEPEAERYDGVTLLAVEA